MSTPAGTGLAPGVAPTVAPSADAAGIDATLLRRLGLTPVRRLSAAGDTFGIAHCRDARGTDLVLKTAPAATADARVRLRNEALLTKHLPVRPPLRLLTYRDHDDGYLLTEYDTGELLRPDRMRENSIWTAVADALVEFQSIRADVSRWGVADLDRPARGYLKVMAKHLAHLWPAHVSAGEAARCAAILRGAMGAILRQSVICHGDFMPTNLLYRRDTGTVVFTDLERFARANHPLFDVLALFTVGEQAVDRWDWQPRFLARYVARSAGTVGLDPHSEHFATAYRGILVFFLAYRLSEARVALLETGYFEGLSKRGFVGRKVAALASGRADAWREERLRAALDVRHRNLRLALRGDEFGEHLEAVRAVQPA